MRQGAAEINADLRTRGLELTIDPRSIYARIEPIRKLNAAQISAIIDGALQLLAR